MTVCQCRELAGMRSTRALGARGQTLSSSWGPMWDDLARLGVCVSYDLASPLQTI